MFDERGYKISGLGSLGDQYQTGVVYQVPTAKDTDKIFEWVNDENNYIEVKLACKNCGEEFEGDGKYCSTCLAS